jgi:hypothetical protein
MPNPNVIFHSDDWTAIPFSLLWTGFFVFWEFGVWKQKSIFMTLWGIPFLVIGNYMVWGRFFVDGWLKRRTYYALTNRRAMILQNGWKTKVSTTYLESIPNIEFEGDSIGTIWLGPKYPVIATRGKKTRDLSRFSVGDVPVFADIDDVAALHRLILNLSQERKAKIASVSALSYKEFGQ